MRRESILIDADAFLASRKLSLIGAIRGASSSKGCLVMCQVAARGELSSIDVEIRALEASGDLTVRAVERRTAADRMYRQLKQDGVDKGEAEAIAWAVSLPADERPIFISADAGARRNGHAHRLTVGDVMDLVVLLIEHGALSTEAARVKLSPWLDREQQQGRPGDLVPFDFDSAYAKRRARWT